MDFFNVPVRTFFHQTRTAKKSFKFSLHEHSILKFLFKDELYCQQDHISVFVFCYRVVYVIIFECSLCALISLIEFLQV